MLMAANRNRGRRVRLTNIHGLGAARMEGAAGYRPQPIGDGAWDDLERFSFSRDVG